MFSHVQSLLRGPHPQGGLVEALMPELAERFAQAPAALRGQAEYAAYLLAHELTRFASSSLAARGLDVTIFGPALAHLGDHPEPHRRCVANVDLLVREAAFSRALRLFGDLGCEPTPLQGVACRFDAPGLRLSLTVHRELPVASFCALRASDLQARAVHFDALGPGVWVPRPDDCIALLVAEAAVQRHRPLQPCFRDLTMGLMLEGLDPSACASHLCRLGLASAARFALPFVHREALSVAQAVLAHLPADPAGRAIAWWAREAVTHVALRGRGSALPFYLLQEPRTEGARRLFARARAALG